MKVPGQERMAALLRPYVGEAALTPDVLGSLHAYLGLLLRWNAHTNLTSIRDAEDLVQRQIGESLFAARFLPASGTLLDFGSGAGFPGIPLRIFRQELAVTLAESQGKKASFLREVLRTLPLEANVWARRVEQMPPVRTFDVVTMRAVDATAAMLPHAVARVHPSGLLVRYLAGSSSHGFAGWKVIVDEAIPHSGGRLVCLTRCEGTANAESPV